MIYIDILLFDCFILSIFFIRYILIYFCVFGFLGYFFWVVLSIQFFFRYLFYFSVFILFDYYRFGFSGFFLLNLVWSVTKREERERDKI